MSPAILVVVGLALADVQLHAKTPREEVADYFAALNTRFWNRVRNFECTTGEETHEGREAVRHLLNQNEAVQDAWVQLAMEATYDPKLSKSWSPADWAHIAFHIEGSAVSRGDKVDPRFALALKKREYLLLDAARRQLQNRGRLQHADLFVALRTWEAIPLLLEQVERDVRRGYAGDYAERLSHLALRDPFSLRLRKLDLRTLDEVALQRFLKDWKDWWQANEKRTPAQALLATARTWQLPAMRDLGTVRLVRTLLEGEASLKDEDLLTFLDAKWPRGQGNNDGDANTPVESRIAWDWSYVRDAVLVISYKRQAKKTLAALEAGLKRNDRVYGDWFKIGDDPLDKDRLFQDWLPPQLKADIEARVSDRNLDPGLRAKWLVLHDQFFAPRGKLNSFHSCAYSDVWSKERGEPVWDVESVGQVNHADLRKALQNRGY